MHDRSRFKHAHWGSEREPKTVVVTGASGGLGRTIAIEFARRGDRIALLARGRAGLEGAKGDVEAAGGTALVIPLDVANHKDVFAAADRIESELGPIDVWVNNAMVTVFGPAMKVRPAKMGFESQQRDEYAESDAPDNLYEAVDEDRDAGSHGAFDARTSAARSSGSSATPRAGAGERCPRHGLRRRHGMVETSRESRPRRHLRRWRGSDTCMGVVVG